uniref:Adaptor related protein complex 1 subunit beta 1 n=1 Tax=Anas platyrhynchos platyrhynchos TaxID=8840 RepID=A0A493TI73_ANAPP
ARGAGCHDLDRGRVRRAHRQRRRAAGELPGGLPRREHPGVAGFWGQSECLGVPEVSSQLLVRRWVWGTLCEAAPGHLPLVTWCQRRVCPLELLWGGCSRLPLQLGRVILQRKSQKLCELKELTPSCSACPSVLVPAGPAAAADSHRQAVPEEAHRDPGAGAASPELGHAGGYRLPARLPLPQISALTPGGLPAGLGQPRPAGPRLHLLAPALHRPRGRQGGGAGREAPHLRGDRPDRAHAAGRAHLLHRDPRLRLPQAAQRLRGGEPRGGAQELAPANGLVSVPSSLPAGPDAHGDVQSWVVGLGGGTPSWAGCPKCGHSGAGWGGHPYGGVPCRSRVDSVLCSACRSEVLGGRWCLELCGVGHLAPKPTRVALSPGGSSRALQHLTLVLPRRSESAESPEAAPSAGQAAEQPAVIPAQGDLLGDLLNLDLGPPVSGPPLTASSVQMGAVDLLGGGLDSLMGDESEGMGGGGGFAAPGPAVPASMGAPLGSGLGDLFDLTGGVGTLSGSYVAPKSVWLPAMKAKGLEISGTFSRQVGSISMDLVLTNKALQVMSDFAIQFNRNSFGLAPAAPLQVHAPLAPNQSVEISLPLNTVGSVMKMDPLNNLQVGAPPALFSP